MVSTPIPCLEALSALERRFDGPIPEHLRQATLRGEWVLPPLLLAEAQVCFFASLIHGQIATIRRRRKDGTFYPDLVSDLRLYHGRRRIWRRELTRLRDQSTRHEITGIDRQRCVEFPVSMTVTSPTTLSSHDIRP